jgi:hypothetical protein
MRNDGQKHLCGRQGISEGVMRTVLGKSERPRQLSEREEANRRLAALDHEQAAQHGRVQDWLAQPDALAAQGGTEERPFHRRGMSHEDTTRHRLEQRGDGFTERRCLLEVDRVGRARP